MQWESNNKKFSFRCDKCKCIIQSEFDEQQDIDDLKEFQLWLECPYCDDGKCFLLTD